MFGTAVDCAKVRIRRRKWLPFQPRKTTMAPRGHIHFHPDSPSYCDDFSTAELRLQAHFIHEMTHVWQVQKHGPWYLILHRRPFSRYDYCLKPGSKLEQYGIEQQGEILRHAFLLRKGKPVSGVADKAAYRLLVDFPGASPG